MLNASGSALNGTNAGFYVNPIRADASTSATSSIVYYNPVTKELTTSTASGGAATTASFIQTVLSTSSATHFLTFVDANNTTATGEILYTTSSVTVNPRTGEVDILSTLPSTSTTTGALVVTGGVGIGGNLYVGGSINSAGTGVVNYSTATNVNSGTYITPRFQSYSEVVTTLASTTAVQNLNLALSNIFDVTLTTNTTFTFSNTATSGSAMPVTVILRQGTGGNFTATFTGARYSDGILPVLSTGANQIDVLSFYTVNGGSFWFGTFAMANVS
jgi:hypothetical protein